MISLRKGGFMKKSAILGILISVFLLFACQDGDGKENTKANSVKPAEEATISPAKPAKTEEKEELTMQSVYEFIKECKTYYLATVEADGQPRVRPFGTIDIFNGKLYIQTAKKKNVSKQLAANPKAELCCFDGKKWLRLSGELVNDDSVEAKKHMLTTTLRFYTSKTRLRYSPASAAENRKRSNFKSVDRKIAVISDFFKISQVFLRHFDTVFESAVSSRLF